jgi:hypothetical protein
VAAEIDARSLVGFEVRSPGGPLGVVVDPESSGREDRPAALVVRGGVSRALFYHVPVSLVSSISPARRSLSVRARSGDFDAQLRLDGSVDLYVR